MYLELNPFPFMGTSECGPFPSQNNPTPRKFSSLPKPKLEFQDETQITPSEDQQQERKRDEKEEREGEILVSCPRIQTQSFRENKEDDDSGGSGHEDGFRTPTSWDQRIPAIPEFPPAPRKPKSVPASAKRKAACRQILLLDLSSEVESLFPPSLVMDLGKKIKKVRKTNAAM
ncbi:hypothetical protein U1Q18_020863 [Sarracenia purpurea var. burkii]